MNWQDHSKGDRALEELRQARQEVQDFATGAGRRPPETPQASEDGCGWLFVVGPVVSLLAWSLIARMT